MNLPKYKLFAFSLFFISFFVFLSSCKESTLNKSDTDFSIEDTASITKIVIKNSEDTLYLEKNNNEWNVDGQYVANISEVKRTLNTLNLITLKSPLPENAVNSVAEKIKNQTNIEIYFGDKIVKSFYLGDYSSNSGNFIMLKDAELPYIAYIPTYNFDLNLNFRTDLKYWMDKVIFHYKPSDISEIILNNYSLNESFYLKNDNDKYILKENQNSEKLLNINQDNIVYYLNHFENIKFINSFENYDQSVVDSLINITPIFEIQITDKNNMITDLKAYSLINNDQIDKNSFIGLVNNEEIILAKFYDFDLLMKNYTYFIK